MTRHVMFFVYPGFVMLDLSGPLEVFAEAEALVPGSYQVTIVSPEGGLVPSSAGCATILTQKAAYEPVDTFVVVGDFGLPNRDLPPETVDFIRAVASKARRTASVCMGAFLLAASGLLDGLPATTHWRYSGRLQSSYPAIRVDGDRVFINHKGVWTSAGMTAGIDMVLAMVEEDLGRETAQSIARMLVVYYRRPGGQYQHSSLLEIEPESDRIRAALAYAREHIAEPLSVERLAEAASLSVRQFSRTFRQATGTTPGKAIERLRVEIARPLVEDGRETFDVIALRVGFLDPERMRQSFLRILNQTPQAMRRISRTQTSQESD